MYIISKIMKMPDGKTTLLTPHFKIITVDVTKTIYLQRSLKASNDNRSKY